MSMEGSYQLARRRLALAEWMALLEVHLACGLSDRSTRVRGGPCAELGWVDESRHEAEIGRVGIMGER